MQKVRHYPYNKIILDTIHRFESQRVWDRREQWQFEGGFVRHKYKWIDGYIDGWYKSNVLVLSFKQSQKSVNCVLNENKTNEYSFTLYF